MLYTKAKLNNGTIVKTDIRANNTFTKCSECGKEINVCLNKFIRSDSFDFNHSEIVCPDCTKKKLEQKIQPKKLLSLILSLADLGFGKEIISVYDNFGIDDINEIKPEDYNNFVYAVLATITNAD